MVYQPGSFKEGGEEPGQLITLNVLGKNNKRLIQ